MHTVKMQLSRKAFIPQLVRPQIYREIRGRHGQVRVCDYSVQRLSPSHPLLSISIELQFLTCKLLEHNANNSI